MPETSENRPLSQGMRSDFMKVVQVYNLGDRKLSEISMKTSRDMDKNSLIRAEIEHIIMEMNNLQDDLIEKYCSTESAVRRGTRDVWDLQRRFTMLTSRLRRLKQSFIPGIDRDAELLEIAKSGRDFVDP